MPLVDVRPMQAQNIARVLLEIDTYKPANQLIHRIVGNLGHDAHALVELAQLVRLGRAPQWFVDFIAAARRVTDTPALRVSEDLFVPAVAASREDIEPWVEHLLSNVSSLQSSDLRIPDPLKVISPIPH